MTHFNKGPSYGLSAEVKNKVRARAGWGSAAAWGRAASRRRETSRLRERQMLPARGAGSHALLLALFPHRGPCGFPDAWSPAAPQGPLEGCRVRPSGKGALLSGLWPLGGALPRGLVSGSCRPRHPPGPGLPWDPASPLLPSHPIPAPSSHTRSWAVTWPNRAPHCSFPPP